MVKADAIQLSGFLAIALGVLLWNIPVGLVVLGLVLVVVSLGSAA
jgi:hypothetical protein